MSLLAKVKKGAGFRGLLNYLRDGRRDQPRVPPGEIIGGNLTGRDPRSLSVEFAAVRRLRPDCKRPVLHESLSLPAGKDLTPEQWRQVAEVYLRAKGIDPDKHPFVLFKHGETEHQHVHIVTSRIAVDGTLAREQRGDYNVAHAAAAAASRAVGLEPQPKTPREARQPRMTTADRREIERGETPARLAIAGRLDEAVSQAVDWQDFTKRAEALGVEIQESKNAGGVYGLKCRLADGAWLKGSQIGKAYTYSSLLRRLQARGADVAQCPIGKPRRDILERLQAQQTAAGTVYRWASGHIAVVDVGNALQWRSGSAAESAALAAVAKAKGWQSVQLADRGSEEKNDEAWLAYARAGIAVTNIKPSKRAYERWVAERDQPSKGAFCEPTTHPASEAGRHDGRGSAEGRGRSGDPKPAGTLVQRGVDAGISRQDLGESQRLGEEPEPAAEEARGQRPPVVEEAPVLSADDERAIWRQLDQIVSAFAGRATTDRARSAIRESLANQIRERLRHEKDDTERRRGLLLFAANLIAPARAPEGLDDARNLLARPASQEALEAAIRAAREQNKPRPTTTPSPRPSADPTLSM